MNKGDLMKIVHVMECFAGGVFTFLTELTKRMTEHQHIVIHGYRENTPENFRELFPSNVTFIEWKYAAREISLSKDYAALKELMKILQGIEKIDVIHLHSSKAGFIGRVAAKLIGFHGNLIYTPHGVSFLRQDVSENKKKFFIVLEWLASKLGGTVVGCSQSERDAIYNVGIKNVIAINNGIDVEITDYVKKPSDVFTIITASRITPQKNAKMFNEIALKFVDNSKIKFVWCGDGEERHYLTAPNIEITGWITEHQVQERIQQADLYLSTSLWEGLPLAVLKAMALGKPLLLSGCVGNIDCVKENGKIFNGSKEAVQLIDMIMYDKKILIKWQRSSVKLFSQEFTLDTMKNRYLELYRKKI